MLRTVLLAFLYPVLIAAVEFRPDEERTITWGTASIVGVLTFLLLMTTLAPDFALIGALSSNIARPAISYLGGVAITAALMLFSAWRDARKR